MDIDTMRTMVRKLADEAWEALSDQNKDRQILLERLVWELRRLAGAAPKTATVILFTSSGKYYTEEDWRIPENVTESDGRVRKTIGPHDMIASPDFRRIDNGAVLVASQEPWGYPYLIPAVP